MRREGGVVIWPTYFDLTKTRGEGRKVPRDLAVHSPSMAEIKEALEELGLNYELVPETSYPKTHWVKTGMFIIMGKGRKNQMVKMIAKQLLKARGTAKRA